MTLDDLIARARQRADDLLAPYLWSDPELTNFANDAEREACRRGRLIVDSTTGSVCNLSLTPNRPTYTLSPLVLFIKRAKLTGQSIPLHPVSFKDLDRCVPGWEDSTSTPTNFIQDMDTGKFRPYPTPDAAGIVTLTVIRMPLDDMTSGSDEPEIRPHLHESLVFWMLYRMYTKQDAETREEKKAAENLAEFEREFGKKSSAFDEAWIEREHGYTPEEGVY